MHRNRAARVRCAVVKELCPHSVGTAAELSAFRGAARGRALRSRRQAVKPLAISLGVSSDRRARHAAVVRSRRARRALGDDSPRLAPESRVLPQFEARSRSASRRGIGVMSSGMIHPHEHHVVAQPIAYRRAPDS